MAPPSVYNVVDYIVFGSTLLFSALIGIYFHFKADKRRTTGEFLLGNQSISVIPVAFSMMTSYWSAVGMLGFPSETYIYGIVLAYQIIGIVAMAPIVIYVYHAVFYNLGLSTVNEYLRRRFGKYASGTATLLFVIQLELYLPMVLYAPALTLNTVTGISLWASISSIGLVCTFYSTLGGIKAVVWTDLFQVLLMFTTLLAVIVKGCIDVGGIGKVWAIAAEGGRINLPSFAFDLTERYGFWVSVIGSGFLSLSVHGVNQMQVQRMMSVGSLKKSRQVIYVTLFAMTLFVIGLCLCGIVIYANLGSCDPLLMSKVTGITSPDQLLPYYIVHSLGKYPGLIGLCVSGIFSASISTVSSGINSLATVTLVDFIKPYCCVGRLTESNALLVSKLLVVAYGLTCILLSYLAQELAVLFQVTLTMSSVLGCPVVGLFTLGMLFVRPNEKGAVVGLVVPSIIFLWIGIGNICSKFYTQRLPQTVEGCSNISSLVGNILLTANTNATTTEERDVFPLYKIAFMWIGAFSFLLTILLGYIVSILTGPNTTVDEELLTPFARWLHGYPTTKEKKTVKMDFKNRDSDLIRADAKGETSHSPGLIQDGIN